MLNLSQEKVMDYLQSQVEASERLYKMMLEDHNQRMKQNNLFYGTFDSLMKKLEERDETIEMLRYELKRIKSKLGYEHE
jgi:hypothetical protein